MRENRAHSGGRIGARLAIFLLAGCADGSPQSPPARAADVEAPSVAISSPAAGSVLSGAVTVTASASDNVGVAGVQFRIDGGNVGAEVLSAPYSLQIDTATFADGAHTLSAVARDAAGNNAASFPVSVSFSNNPGAGGSISAASCSSADVQAAINLAGDGDAVIIPAGDCSWTTGVSIAGKGIHLKAAAKGGVTITHDGTGSLIAATSDDNRHVEISNLRFVEGSAFADNFLSVGGSGKAVLVHDNYFETNGGLIRSIRWQQNRGVIWNNEFYSNGVDDQAIVFVNNFLDSSWATADTMGARDVNGDANVYVEDNIFTRIFLQALDPDSNSRVVIRHNLFDNSALASHGADTSEDGARHWEVYDNTFRFTNFGECSGAQTLNLNWFFYIRGGTGVIADNAVDDIKSCAWGDKAEWTMTVQNLRRNSGPYPCWKTYPAPRQIGQSHDGATFTTDPVYIWGNSGTAPQAPVVVDYAPNECGAGAPSAASFVQAGRDFIVGTPKPGYSKYAYPHPLRTN